LRQYNNQLEISPDAIIAVPIVRHITCDRPDDRLGRQHVQAIAAATSEGPQAIAFTHAGKQGVVLVQVVAEPERSVMRIVVGTPVVKEGHECGRESETWSARDTLLSTHSDDGYRNSSPPRIGKHAPTTQGPDNKLTPLALADLPSGRGHYRN